MKKIILLISAAFLLAIGVNAQWPEHPMDTRKGDKPEYLIEKMSHRDSLSSLPGGYILHKYSLDGYIDTIYGNMYTMVHFYSKETNKLVKQDLYESIIDHPIQSSSLFEYDNQGRLIAEHFTFYVYDSKHNSEKNEVEFTLKETNDSTYRYDYSTVVYTDSSYIYNDVEHVFDKQNRLIRTKTSINVIEYTYFDNNKGYSLFSYRTQAHPEFEAGLQQKEEHFFDEKGLLVNSRTYRKFDHQTEWTFWYNEFFDYTFYEDDGSTTQSNQEIERIHQVYGIEGAIRVQAGQPEWVSVYSIAGQLVQRQYVSDNATLYLPKGIYIVTAGKESQKVMVR